MTNSPILIVEDDIEIREALAEFLAGKGGYIVHQAGSVEEALACLAREAVDLVLLDIMLPGEDGLALCRRLRAAGAAQGPRIIMLTALIEPTDKVVGLELGADDYVSKPFDLRELLARIRAVLRRPGEGSPAAGRPLSPAMAYRFAGFVFYPQHRYMRSRAGVRIPLTGAETDLLLVFCQHPRRVLAREELLALTRGDGAPVAVRSIDLLVSRLRRKLAGDDPLEDPIRTVRADGYALHYEVTVASAA